MKTKNASHQLKQLDFGFIIERDFKNRNLHRYLKRFLYEL